MHERDEVNAEWVRWAKIHCNSSLTVLMTDSRIIPVSAPGHVYQEVEEKSIKYRDLVIKRCSIVDRISPCVTTTGSQTNINFGKVRRPT
jgi:hypothetical protein